MSNSHVPQQVRVMTTARLHMGFLDLHGGLGRRFGSIGLSLQQPALTVTARRSTCFAAAGTNAERSLHYAQRFAARLEHIDGAELVVESLIPEHAGMGSGTQLALAVGVALARLYELPLSLAEVAALTERGARSGIGIGAFAQGGLLVDGGRGANTVLPPILVRMAFPEEWRILLIFDHSDMGVHGGQEVEAFRTLPEFPEVSAAEICRYVLMQALPAVMERDLAAFGEAIHEIQCRIGDYFAEAQGGGRYTSAAVGSVLEWLRAQGIGCVGQSSWGPTGFAVVESQTAAQIMRERLAAKYADQRQLDFLICQARNQGSDVQVQYVDEVMDARRALK
jgi:beta-RFAP synthase